MDPTTPKKALELLDRLLSLDDEEGAALRARVAAEDADLSRELESLIEHSRDATILPEGGHEASVDLPVCAHFTERYELGEEIAAGGVGRVIRAFDRELGRPVAVKMLREIHRDAQDAIRRFLGEARIAAILSHPGITTIHEVGRTPDGRPFMAMRLVEGVTLADRLEQHDRSGPGPAELLGVFEQVCQTMAYAHSRGVLHRDLKPENIMVGKFGEVQVMDWGLAKVRPQDDAEHRQENGDPGGEAAGTETLMGSVMGSPAYMAPEQAVGLSQPPTDVFSLGGILCTILTGSPPYRGKSTGPVLEQAMHGQTGEARARLEACPHDRDLVKIALDCLEADPDRRPRDAGELASRLAAHRELAEQRLKDAELAGEKAKARAAAERRIRLLTWAIGGSLLLAALIGMASWVGIERAARTEREQRQRTQREIDSAAEQTRQLFEAAKRAPLLDRDTWNQLEESLRGLDALMDIAPPGAAGNDHVAQLIREIGVRRAEQELVFDIDAARQEGIDALRFHPHQAREHEALVSLLRERGFDPAGATAPEQVSRRISDYPDAAREELIGALDEWLLASKQEEKPWLAAVLEEVDGDPWRRNWRAAYLEGNRDALLDSFSLEKLAGRSPRSIVNAARSVRKLLSTDEIVATLRRLRARQDYALWINLELGRICWTSGRQQEAVTYYQVALAVRPTASVHGVLAGAAQVRGDHLIASDHWREAIRLGPGVRHYQLGLGECLMKTFEYEEAMKAFRHAILLSGPESSYLINQHRLNSEQTLAKIPVEEHEAWRSGWRQVGALFGGGARYLSRKAEWIPLSPRACVSEAGAECVQGPDGTVAFRGPNELNDTYTITIEPGRHLISALKLEVIKDPGLPGGGPGRGTSGDFELSGFVLELTPPEGKPRRVPIQQVWADDWAINHPLIHAIDGEAESSWRPGSRDATSIPAIFLLGEPLQLETGMTLQIRMQHGGETGAAIGKFRFSATELRPRTLP